MEPTQEECKNIFTKLRKCTSIFNTNILLNTGSYKETDIFENLAYSTECDKYNKDTKFYDNFIKIRQTIFNPVEHNYGKAVENIKNIGMVSNHEIFEIKNGYKPIDTLKLNIVLNTMNFCNFFKKE